ncbi:MAG: HlyD family efflux transporter periplasmic adaptor subunit [Anaerolineales bacterium]|nr:HlyD family efflux transporter periplasmic adaptor subunit [Anaerolineales bacterium]
MRRIFPLLLLAMLIAGCALQPITEPRRPDPDTEPTIVPTAIAIEKPTYVVAHGPVSSQLFKSGRVAPVTQSQLSFMINGQIEALLVGSGTVVSAGDVVATLSTAALEQALAEAEAALSLAQDQLAVAAENQAADQRRAEIALELVQLQLDYAVDAAGDTPTSEQSLAIATLQLQVELAQLNLAEFDGAPDPTLMSQVAQAQVDVENLQTQIEESSLVTPIAGTVMVVNAAVGDAVAAGETVLVIADLNELEVQVTLLDRELQTLSEGMAALGTIPSRPDASFAMTVRQLPYPYGTGAQGTEADTTVRISFDNSAQMTDVNIGDRLEIAILLEQHEDVLWLPPAAIREFNGRLFVVIQDGQSQRRVDVKIGLQNENQVEITSGVSEGQVVVGP